MSGSDGDPKAGRRRQRQTVVIQREDHIGDKVGIAWLESPETGGDFIIERLRDYLGRRIKITKADVSRDKIEVEIESRGWREEAARLAAAAHDLYEKGAKRNALAMCREAIELDPASPDAMAALGLMLVDQKQDMEAFELLRRAREFGANGLDVLLAITQSAKRLGHQRLAELYAQETLRIDPRNFAARRILKAIRSDHKDR